MRGVVVVEVRGGSSEFDRVLALWRPEGRTLGFMPLGGFEDAAARRALLAAKDEQGGVVGYVLYRRTNRGYAAIVHLCVAPPARGTGVAQILFDAVKARCADVTDIRLRCRRDFPARALWQKLGFLPVAERPGKKEGARLTTWRYEVNALPLLQRVDEVRDETVLRAVIDTNVFLDLDDEQPGDEESLGLLADWLSEFVSLSLTAEIFVEIDRRESLVDRERQRKRTAVFGVVRADKARADAAYTRVRPLLPDDGRPSTDSDARHIANTIGQGLTFFVTRDQRVLDTSDSLYEIFGLRVVSPHELILRFDELRREEEYRPMRLFLGPGVIQSRPRADGLKQLADLAHAELGRREPRRRTLAHLKTLLAAPDTVEGVRILAHGEILAAYFVDRSVPGVLTVPFFAVAASSLGATAARHYAQHLCSLAAREGRSVVHVLECGRSVMEALAETGFSRENGTWVKIALACSAPRLDMARAVERVASTAPMAAALATRIAATLRQGEDMPALPGSGAEIERTLWPAKIAGLGLPCFLVPIQPGWAAELFDVELATGTLFGAQASLVLNSENVYYRAAAPSVVSAPARVLWYVSHHAAYPGSKAVRACSYVDEVVVATPKDLFRRFKRIGVYGWRDVFELAKRDVQRPIMAFRFSKTEPFREPVSWDALQAVLRDEIGNGSPLVSPVSIPEECFLRLYRLGMGGNVDGA